MRHIASVWITILIIIIAGCSPTDTPTPDFTLGAVLQGDWLVETMDTGEDWVTLGALAIDGNNYRFDQVPAVEIPP